MNKKRTYIPSMHVRTLSRPRRLPPSDLPTTASWFAARACRFRAGRRLLTNPSPPVSESKSRFFNHLVLMFFCLARACARAAAIVAAARRLLDRHPHLADREFAVGHDVAVFVE